MTDALMPLEAAELDEITRQVATALKTQLPQWMAEQSLGKPPVVYEIELRERMIRVEEELKHQRELMMQGFDQMEKRFASMQQQMDKRFEQVDKRFEAMQQQMDKRFEQVDKRFESVQQQMDKRFESMQQQMDKRFEQVDKRFESMSQEMTRFMRWSYAITLTCAGLVIAAIKL